MNLQNLKKNFFRTLKHRGKYGFGPGDDEIRGMGSRTSGAKAAFLSFCNFLVHNIKNEISFIADKRFMGEFSLKSVLKFHLESLQLVKGNVPDGI